MVRRGAEATRSRARGQIRLQIRAELLIPLSLGLRSNIIGLVFSGGR